MLTYIENQDISCHHILNNRLKILERFLEIAQEYRVKKWIFLATGSSLNAVNCAKMYLENISNIEIEIRIPSEFVTYSELWDKDAFIFGVSQSGSSSSTIDAVKKAVSCNNVPVFGITANENSNLVKNSPHWIKIECGEEKVRFVTKGFTATSLTLMLMGLEYSFSIGRISKEKYSLEIQKFTDTVNFMKDTLTLSKKWYKDNISEFLQIQRMSILAYGPSMGSAMEAETKLSETVRCPSTGYELEEFMHGPHLELNDNYYIFFIGAPHQLQSRLILLKNTIQKYTEHLFYIGIPYSLQSSKDLVLNQEIDEYIYPLIATIPFQYLSYQLAIDKGIDLDKKLYMEFDQELKRKI